MGKLQLTDHNVYGTSLQRTIFASYNELVAIFGGPANTPDDDEKCGGMSFSITNGSIEGGMWAWKVGDPRTAFPDLQFDWSMGSPGRYAGELADEIEAALEKHRAQKIDGLFQEVPTFDPNTQSLQGGIS